LATGATWRGGPAAAASRPRQAEPGRAKPGRAAASQAYVVKPEPGRRGCVGGAAAAAGGRGALDGQDGDERSAPGRPALWWPDHGQEMHVATD